MLNLKPAQNLRALSIFLLPVSLTCNASNRPPAMKLFNPSAARAMRKKFARSLPLIDVFEIKLA